MRLLTALVLLVLCPFNPRLGIAQDHWIRLDSILEEQLTSVQFFDEERGYVTSRNGHFLRTFDGGAHWEDLFVTYPHPFAHIEIFDMVFHDSLIGVVAGSVDTTNGLVPEPHAALFWTYDGGKTWDPQIFNEDAPVQHLQFLDRKFGFFATSMNDEIGKASVYYTNAGGFRSELWQKRTNFPSAQNINGMAFSDNALGILSGGDELVIPSNLFLTTDEGENWISFVGDQGGSSSSLGGFYWNGDGLLATSGSRIVFSLDSGRNWGIVASTGGSAFYTGFAFADEKVGFATPLFSGQILKTRNGGFAWEVQQLPEFAMLMDLWPVSEHVAYAVGNSGKIFKLTSQSSVAKPKDDRKLRVYPNPAVNVAVIEAPLLCASQIGHVLDGLGREVRVFKVGADGVARLDLHTLVAGAYTILIDGLTQQLIVQ